MLRALLIITAAQMANVAADTIDAELKNYIGMHAEQMVGELGDPMLRTPQELWYRHEPTISEGNSGVPNPTATLGRTGVIIYGPGVDYSPLAMSRDLCDVVVKLDRKGIITGIDHHGPGCFEFIHLLKLRNATPP
jgi:hypothetical protein